MEKIIPYWGEQTDGIVTCYMCGVAFEHDLAGDKQGTKLYPSEEALRKHHNCIDECGVVKVFVEQDVSKSKLCMERIAFEHELGGALDGVKVYPDEESCRKHERYSKRYGVVFVKVTLGEVIQEQNLVPKKEETSMSVNPYLLALEAVHGLEDHIKAWIAEFPNQKLDVPDDAQPAHLLKMCEVIRERASEEGDDFPVSKLHRWIGHIQGCLITTRVATVDQIKDIMRKSKLAFGEKPDDDLMRHLDPDSPFFLDIGGEG